MIKHNFPFIPPHCGVHIAQSRGTVPDHPAQMLFDLLNLRNFALSLPIRNTPKRRCPLTWGGICTTATLPFQPVRKEGGVRNRLLFHQKRDACLLWRTQFGLLPFISYPPMQRMLVCVERFFAVLRNYRRERFPSLGNYKTPHEPMKDVIRGE